MNNTLIILTVVDILLLAAGLAIYLFIVGGQLSRVADRLEECADLVWDIKKNADGIEPGLSRINGTGGVVAGALPLLYGMAEGIVHGATYEPAPADEERPPARPAMGTRRSRQLDGVGYHPGA
jgi:hypothetical protein